MSSPTGIAMRIDASTEPSRSRARPLDPEDRRAAIVDAVIPVIIEHGRDVTTRQIADAAGVAEGTIFRAFGDKETLIRAAAERYFELGPIGTAMRAIDPASSLESKVNDILFIVRQRMRGALGMMNALGMTGRPRIPDNRADLESIIEEVLAPNLAELAMPAPRVLQFIRLVSMSASIPSFNQGQEISTSELARMITYGVAGRPAPVKTTRKSAKEGKPHAA